MPQFVINMSAAVSDVNTESLTKIFFQESYHVVDGIHPYKVKIFS